MKKTYQDLIEKGLLKEEKINFAQVRKVLYKSKNDLKSAGILSKNIQYENAYELAYEAMLSAGRALAFSLGLRPRAQGSHKIVGELIQRIFGNVLIVKKLDKIRRKRHYLIYEAGLSISKIEASSALKNAQEFISQVEDFIKKTDPQKDLFN